MKWFIHKMETKEVTQALDSLLAITNKFSKLEDDLLNMDFANKDERKELEDAINSAKEIAEKDFEARVADLVDFNYIASNHTSELLDEIAEIDSDALLKKAEECL